MFKQTILSFVIIAYTFSISYAGDRTWTTQETLQNGIKIVLYWTGVYEGRDTVYQVKIGDTLVSLNKQHASGQPVQNLKNNLIALPYCADDGCQAKVNILDISKKKLLPPIELPYTGQFYITCKWNGGILEIEFDPTQWTKPKDHKRTFKYSVTSEGVALQK